MSKKTVLVITDGIGYSPKHEYNAFRSASKPTYDRLFQEVPHAFVDTFGLSVGLPEGQMGNSEVGHMSIGSGRVLYQDLVKISLSLEDGSFAKNPLFSSLLKTSKRLHLIALMSDGGVHSHIDHMMGVADIAAEEGKEVWLHLITDGRDVAPKSAKLFLHTVNAHGYNNVKIGSIGGRFYTMDRDNRWERVQKGYEAIMSAHPKSEQSVADYIENAYAAGETDEFITPTAFEGFEGVQPGDAVLMLNFRSDRMREITTAIGDPEFSGFKRTFVPTHLATMTQYDKNFPYPVLFPKDAPKNTLAEVISRAGLRQLHTAETEKYAHVTFFFNGGIEEPYENETRVLIPSPQVKTYDMKPEMSAPEVGDVVVKAIDDGYDFIVVNFANGDMVGHTGNFEAAVKGVEAVDAQLGRIVEAAQRNGYAMVLTSDHGNCEEMRDDAGNMLTNHTVGKVWCFVMADGVTQVHPGALNNIAPTVLKLMGLEIPAEMDMPLI
ncbi:2,3-bisphosphoglycerate-independent phosphoglycerate mutase [Sulfuricurvum sp.]|uniref:2,3-bisphosphoglycerate-independent phosphoglycerate mutase n=1 Tax=Sulfuricurvum sp. TaxID=2025608 RepID=UPI002634C7D1|nr:2,3-bisphosphoglycerate-independent phosphoglycerate mutase [Sulfuricurvum sp.]MDD2839093.1 2,3-bisphosphoglycerate-independent phosphoglycerate mutase [Sulfuricurvum sp.]MDD3595820.1 2,3-bisphosphoglycerate-independent phosphoglycerate mutase [Sulfuricurvum sp.]MDD4883830.1 2,3-bisphosphoglycerate-independent phosphoglycerate mutase [Sulfuricurvum sp.]